MHGHFGCMNRVQAQEFLYVRRWRSGEVRTGRQAHENEFFRYFAKSVKAYFDKKGIRACLLGMPTCLVNDRLQIDALLITPKTLTIIDFKDYGGRLLLPDETEFRRGSWMMDSGLQVKGGSSPNPIYQTGLQRDRLMKTLELTCRNLSTFDPHHIFNAGLLTNSQSKCRPHSGKIPSLLPHRRRRHVPGKALRYRQRRP